MAQLDFYIMAAAQVVADGAGSKATVVADTISNPFFRFTEGTTGSWTVSKRDPEKQ